MSLCDCAAQTLTPGGTNAVLAQGETNTAVTQVATNAVLGLDATNSLGLTEPSESPERPPYRPWSIGVEGGTLGFFGGKASWRFADHFGLGAAIDYGQVTWNNLNIAGIQYDAKLRLMSQPLVFDLYPWKKHSFHFSLGVLFNENQLTGTTSESGIVVIDGHPLPIVAGKLSMRVNQKLLNPYLSMGGNFFYFDHAHHWAMGGELGVAYTGKPEVQLSRDGLSSPAIDAALEAAQYELQKYANQYEWWPVAKLSVSYSF